MYGFERYSNILSNSASIYKFGPTHEILVGTLNAQEPNLNLWAGVSSEVRSFDFGLDFHLHLFFVCANQEGSGQSQQFCRLPWAFVAQQRDRY